MVGDSRHDGSIFAFSRGNTGTVEQSNAWNGAPDGPSSRIAAILAIVLAGTLTAYVQRDRLGFGGGGNEPERLSYAEATGEDPSDPGLVYDVPSAEECTVEPLTVDQVMQKLDSRVDTAYLREARATTMAEFGTPDFPGMEPVLEMPQETFDELAAIQREWLACALYGSPFQRWALETSALVQQEILARYYPVVDLARLSRTSRSCRWFPRSPRGTTRR
jgi:hypothetical protein